MHEQQRKNQEELKRRLLRGLPREPREFAEESCYFTVLEAFEPGGPRVRVAGTYTPPDNKDKIVELHDSVLPNRHRAEEEEDAVRVVLHEIAHAYRNHQEKDTGDPCKEDDANEQADIWLADGRKSKRAGEAAEE